MPKATRPKPFKTLDARPDHGSMIKPAELIDVIEISPLTLTDRRIYNTLIANAWDRSTSPSPTQSPKETFAEPGTPMIALARALSG